ncbi:MAG: ThuA domain-containing protein [Bacteroidetes bacterium]|nr:ThuA domain-containing protein [Bacteroidota bacterium]
MRITLFLLIVLLATNLAAQKKVLHYTETSGYDHQTRANSLLLFQQLGNTNNFTVTDDLTGEEFNDLNELLSYDLIIFSNTSGENILDQTQKSHFEQYIQNGGAFFGIHAATDTYRHSLANGNSTGTWDFYAETLGGSVQENPNHVSGTPLYSISKKGTHPSTANLPNPWAKNEEYYYWENGYLDPLIQVLLEVEQTVGPNNMVNSYDAKRAVAWCKILTSNSRIFYTSLGHDNSDYTSNTVFQQLIKDATRWCLGLDASVSLNELNKTTQVFPNPTRGEIHFLLNGIGIQKIEIFDVQGQLIRTRLKDLESINISELPRGLYTVKLETELGVILKKCVKQ